MTDRESDLTVLPSRLQRWYLRRRRDLPWRGAEDAYATWISEVMLQQTRVDTVIPYYERFMERFPSPAALADADEDEVLRLWAGLGYYRRGRDLRRAATCIVRDHGGSFPRDAEAIRELPGIGDYTTAAIRSIAFGEPSAVVDGNVERVLCRYLGYDGDPRRREGRHHLLAAAEAALDRQDPGTHNQAMMELGALVCTPRAPRCPECPISAPCAARRRGRPEDYPRPRPRRPTETQYWIACAVMRGGDILLQKTPPEAELLRGQWGVPLVRWLDSAAPAVADSIAAAAAACQRAFGVRAAGSPLEEIRHSITFRRLRVIPVRFAVGRTAAMEARACAPGKERELAALFRKIIARAR